MLDVQETDDWDGQFFRLFETALDDPDTLIDRLGALLERPGAHGAGERDTAIARVFTLLVNNRHYDVARDMDAAFGLRRRIEAMTASGMRLSEPADRDAMFCLAVLDTQHGGDAARGRAGFIALRDMLPEGHHLIKPCDDGENVAATVMGRQSRPAESAGIRFIDFTAVPDESRLPPLDRADVDESRLTPEQLSWRRDGVLLLEGFLPEDLVDAYVARRGALENPAGWLSPSPYQHVPEMLALALYPKLMEIQKHLLGEDMLLHLALTGWISTERNWHQDDYLNPDFVTTWYTAVWMALDTIDPDCGPFEYIPGSHRWPLMSGEKVRQLMSQEERDRREGPQGINQWATYSERFVAPAIETEIQERGVAPVRFHGKKGDVLIWHSRLMHRGTAPRRPNLERRSLIAHYSGVNHRPDMPDRVKDAQGHSFATFKTPLY